MRLVCPFWGRGGVSGSVFESWLLNFQDSAMQVLNTAIIKKIIM